MKNLPLLTLAVIAASLLFACHPKYEYPTVTETETNGDDGKSDDNSEDEDSKGEDGKGDEEDASKEGEEETQDEADYVVSITRVRTAPQGMIRVDGVATMGNGDAISETQQPTITLLLAKGEGTTKLADAANVVTGDVLIEIGSDGDSFSAYASGLEQGATYTAAIKVSGASGSKTSKTKVAEVGTLEECEIFEPEEVDMGLSVIWSKANLGTTDTLGTGIVTAWGELNPSSYYSGDSYTLAAFQPLLANGIGGSEVTDAANAHTAGKWRLPTYEEMRELWKGCDRYPGKSKSGTFMKLKSRKNGAEIYLPCAGLTIGNEIVNEEYLSSTEKGKKMGCYMTSTPSRYLHFSMTSSGANLSSQVSGDGQPWWGYCIRAVKDRE